MCPLKGTRPCRLSICTFSCFCQIPDPTGSFHATKTACCSICTGRSALNVHERNSYKNGKTIRPCEPFLFYEGSNFIGNISLPIYYINGRINFQNHYMCTGYSLYNTTWHNFWPIVAFSALPNYPCMIYRRTAAWQQTGMSHDYFSVSLLMMGVLFTWYNRSIHKVQLCIACIHLISKKHWYKSAHIYERKHSITWSSCFFTQKLLFFPNWYQMLWLILTLTRINLFFIPYHYHRNYSLEKYDSITWRHRERSISRPFPVSVRRRSQLYHDKNSIFTAPWYREYENMSCYCPFPNVKQQMFVAYFPYRRLSGFAMTTGKIRGLKQSRN